MAAMVFDSETRVEIEKIATKTKQQTGAFFFFFFFILGELLGLTLCLWIKEVVFGFI
jgi:hypothetical protein